MHITAVWRMWVGCLVNLEDCRSLPNVKIIRSKPKDVNRLPETEAVIQTVQA